MISPQPEWTLSTQNPLTKCYGHVHLEPDLVIGQWFAADRRTGRVLWEKSLRRPNTIQKCEAARPSAPAVKISGYNFSKYQSFAK